MSTDAGLPAHVPMTLWKDRDPAAMRVPGMYAGRVEVTGDPVATVSRVAEDGVQLARPLADQDAQPVVGPLLGGDQRRDRRLGGVQAGRQKKQRQTEQDKPAAVPPSQSAHCFDYHRFLTNGTPSAEHPHAHLKRKRRQLDVRSSPFT